MEIRGINHIGIRVSNLETARAFYEQLGFEFIVGPVGPEPVAIMRHPGGVVINFILNAPPTESPVNVLMDQAEKLTGYTHMALEVPDLDATLAQLARLGIPLSGGPIDAGEARFAFVRDPDANVIEFNAPSAPGGMKQSHH